MPVPFDRLKEAMDAAGLSEADLARLLNTSPQTVNNWKRRGGMPDSWTQQVAKALRVSIDALYAHAKDDVPIAARIAPSGSMPISWDDENPLPNGGDAYLECPHYDVVLSAGHGIEASWVQHSENDPLAFRAAWWRKKRLKPEHCRALYVHGDSMLPYLKDWDTVMVDITQTTPIDGEIYALLLDGELYIKRLYRVPGGGLEIRSDNPAYRPVELRGSDLERLVILGREVHRSG